MNSYLSKLTADAENGDSEAQFMLGEAYRTGKGARRNYKTAFSVHSRYSETNNRCRAVAGMMCLEGKGTEKDERKGFGLLNSAEPKGPETLFRLGQCFEFGLGTDPDPKKAFEYYLDSAEQGFGEAQAAAGRCCFNGTGTDKNMAEAEKWFLEAIGSDVLSAYSSLGIIKEKAGQPDVAFQCYTIAALGGDSTAQYNLGLCYYLGKGTEKNDREAFSWFLKSAEQKCTDAMYIASSMLKSGIGTETDEKKAVELLEKAVSLGDANSCFTLATMYVNGDGVPHDFKKAYRLYYKSAHLGHTESMYSLAVCYENGIGIKKNLTESFRWFLSAAKNGNTEAMGCVADCYNNGYGGIIDFDEGFKWLKLAAMEGNPRSMCNLGTAYYNGEGTDRDFQKAIEWYNKAAENGVPEGWRGLGSCYLKDSAHRDYTLAAFYFEKGAMAEDIPSMRNLGLLLFEGIGVPRDPETAFSWFLRGAEKEDHESEFYLSCCYSAGEGTETD